MSIHLVTSFPNNNVLFIQAICPDLLRTKASKLTKEAKEKAAKLCYGYLLVQHQSLRFFLEMKFLIMVNAIFYQ